MKNLLFNLFVLLTTTTGMFFLGEVGLRFKFKAWPFDEEIIKLPYLTPRDESLRYRFSPGDGKNSLGLRNREVTEKEDQFRVLFLGDSLVWSGDTSSGELYTQVIEKNLNRDLDGKGKKVEVVNVGIPGYTTYQELEFLKIYGLSMKPDLVILGFVYNDLFYKYLHRPTKIKLLDGEPSSRLNRFNVYEFPGILFSRSYLAHEIALGLDLALKKITQFPYFPFDHRADFYLAWKDYAWKKESELIGEMSELLKKKGIKFIIVSFPVSNQVDDQYLELNREYVLFPQRKINEISGAYGIPHLDFTDTLYQNGGIELFKDFLHLNSKGNDIVARTMTDYLSSNICLIEEKKGCF